ncbi:MAG: hypothetical protein ACJAZP_002513, partial [Psychromonas sp.]|uniref:immunoglobulin-like domain-containing protein n=1 Tax=Psychromonas sp. TaxID=1884585 RepID=UPI0039E6D8C5
TAQDETDGDLTSAITIVSDVNTSVAGTYSVTYSVTDSDGNAASISRTVIVRDNTLAPLLTLLGADPINLNLNETFTDPGATAQDETDGDLTSAITIVSDVNTSVAATYTVTYSVTDSDGNSASIIRTVIVRDNTLAPVLTLIGADPINLNLNETFTDPGATAQDETDGDLSADITAVSDVNTSVAATYSVTYSVTDSDGNSASISRTVIVRDNTLAPVLTLLGVDPINLNLNETFTDPGATAQDETDGDLTTDITAVSDVNTSVAATYSVTYSVVDSDGNAASIIRTVIVRDNTLAPVLTLLGVDPINLNLNETFTDPGATAQDETDGDLTSAITIVSDVNTSVASTYSVTYSVVDSDGNSASIIRTVIVRDNTLAPVLTLIGADPINLNIGDLFTDPGATAQDETDGDLTSAITAVSDVNTSIAATYTVTYSVTDSDGNAASISRTVIVRDNTLAPVLTLLGADPINLNLNETFTDPGATAQDETDGDLTSAITIVSDVNTSVAATYSVTYSVVDSDGNSASIIRTVIVRDNTLAPVLTLLGTDPINLNIGDLFTDPGATAQDETDGDLTTDITTVSDVNTNVAATYSVTYSVTDSDGNSASLSRTVIVSDAPYEVIVLQSRVSASADDAKERAGSVYLTSADLELVLDNNYLQIIGLRFRNLSIPENAIITRAYIQFQADETDFLLDTQLKIVAEKNNNAATFTSAAYNISSRAKTNASVSWSPAAWDTIGAAGEDQRSSDLTAIVQEIISETGWNSGNAMAFIFTGSGRRVAEAYDGDQAGAPLLYVEYTTELSSSAPVLTLLGADPIPLNLGETFTDPGATALDDNDGDLTADIQTVSDVNTSVAATYTVTYSVTDSDGNSTSISRTVIVRDNSVAPVLTLLGADPINLNLNETFTDPGATAQDETDGDLTSAITAVSDVNTSVAATYTVTYSVIDSDGNGASFSRTVIVHDNTGAPVLTLNGADQITLNLGETFTDPGATAQDETDGDLSADITTVSDVNTSVAATYTVTYSVTDSDGNSASIIRTVIVRDNTVSPVLTLIGADPINLNLGETFTDPGATAQDETDGDLSADVTNVSDVDTSVAATYTVTYSVTDTDGNSASLSRTVIVSDAPYEVTVLQSRVSASADDAKERAGSVYLTSADLELVLDNNYLQIIGLRFRNLSIPANAIITRAYIQFQADETDFLLDTQLNIVAEKNNNAATFTSAAYNISSRSKTNASISWSPAAWDTIGAAGEEQRSSDLTAIVQEIVSETDWNSGNAMAFIFTGSGRRVAEAYDGDQAGAPLLHVEYSTE